MNGLAITREEIGTALWRAVDFDRSRVGDINVLADAVLLLMNMAHEDARHDVERRIRALCEDSEADSSDPYYGLVSTVDLRNIIDQDGP